MEEKILEQELDELEKEVINEEDKEDEEINWEEIYEE
jgi:hypothetical protein